MQGPFHILHLEDNVRDRELTAAALAADGLDCSFTYATGRPEFLRALANDNCDIILCDFTLPGYSGLAALEAARKHRPEVPFLFVSGTIGEERAVASLKMGAADCVLKDHPGHLQDLPARRTCVKTLEPRLTKRMSFRVAFLNPGFIEMGMINGLGIVAVGTVKFPPLRLPPTAHRHLISIVGPSCL